MHIWSFMMGSTVETPLAKLELHGPMAWLLSQTFRTASAPQLFHRSRMFGR